MGHRPLWHLAQPIFSGATCSVLFSNGLLLLFCLVFLWKPLSLLNMMILSHRFAMAEMISIFFFFKHFGPNLIKMRCSLLLLLAIFVHSKARWKSHPTVCLCVCVWRRIASTRATSYKNEKKSKAIEANAEGVIIIVTRRLLKSYCDVACAGVLVIVWQNFSSIFTKNSKHTHTATISMLFFVHSSLLLCVLSFSLSFLCRHSFVMAERAPNHRRLYLQHTHTVAEKANWIVKIL